MPTAEADLTRKQQESIREGVIAHARQSAERDGVRTPPFFTNSAHTEAWLQAFDARMAELGKTPMNAVPDPEEDVPVERRADAMAVTIRDQLDRIAEQMHGLAEYTVARQYVIEARNVCPEPKAGQ